MNSIEFVYEGVAAPDFVLLYMFEDVRYRYVCIGLYVCMCVCVSEREIEGECVRGIDHSLAISIRTKGFLGDESCVWRMANQQQCALLPR